jgi:hypothetical protein
LAQELNGPGKGNGVIHGGPSDYQELYEKLKPGNTLQVRLGAASAVRDALKSFPVSGVSSIWYAAKDLIEASNSVDTRRAGFELLIECAKQTSATDLERHEYFITLTDSLHPADFQLQLNALTVLAKNGRDLSGFYYDCIPLLTKWLRMAFDMYEKVRKNPRQRMSTQPKSTLEEERNLFDLFSLLVNVIKFSFNVSDDDETASLIDTVIEIAERATLPITIQACVRVIDAIITYGSIPTNKLSSIMTVLCSTHFLVKESKEEAWNTISNLCQSHNGHTAVGILMNVLHQPETSSKSQALFRKVRGAISVLTRIIEQDGKNNFPDVPFAPLIAALSASLAVNEIKVEQDVLQLIITIFGCDDGRLKLNVMDEDWTAVFDVVVKCAARASETSEGKPLLNPKGDLYPLSPTSTVSSATDNSSVVATSITQFLNSLIVKIESLVSSTSAENLTQRESCIVFLASVADHLPDSSAQLVINHYKTYRYCYPSDVNWDANCRTLLEAFFLNKLRPTTTRLLALDAVVDVYSLIEMMEEFSEIGINRRALTEILSVLDDEKDAEVLEPVMAVAVSACQTGNIETFDFVIKQLHQSITNDRINSPLFSEKSRPPPASLLGVMNRSESPASGFTPANIITRGIIQIFQRVMDSDAAKAIRAFDEILWIARSNSVDTDGRLSAMKMLFRLRADWANRIFLTRFTESDALASTLYRTSASLSKKHALDEAQKKTPRDDPRSLRSASGALQSHVNTSTMRTVSGVTRTLQRDHQLWMTPDADALPEPASDKASTVLVSLLETEPPAIVDGAASEVVPETEQKALKINIWLETLIGLLQQGCDWEVYSYILVHLPSQLTNHALFKGAVPQIKLLRGVLCDQLKQNNFHEPPLSSGLRKADVAICLFQVLTVVMSYHQHFQRSEEDDIVKVFIHGVGAWERAAKGCVHALSICCHEMPASMKSVLGSILLKMAQIITQSHVAVHILEFLACLSRLPSLYSNFREDEYRTVFAICFKYIVYAREQNLRSGSPSDSSSIVPNSRPVSGAPDTNGGFAEATKGDSNILPNASDDLPQYVFALAYYVITYWFTALPLRERAKHIRWVIKNLVWVDDTGAERLDEQGEVLIDFIRRTSYADADESKADPNFSKDNVGDILKERWVIGQSIITVEQATRTGWAQVTKRSPSATSHYMIKQKFDPPQPHQVVSPADGVRDPSRLNSNHFLPANIPLALMHPTFSEAHPIHLPDNDQVTRALGALDRISTVDGHKVGVIYIGAGQSHEAEILRNVSGSVDYMELLSYLGTLVKLKNATFNTQGLDRHGDMDGEYTIAWRDRITELVYHVTTMMPTNLEHDPQCIGKKRHIGNDFVNIIFNNSGNPFDFNTFPSEFNYVNIVITPESRASFSGTRDRSAVHPESSFYKVQVMSKEGFPEISPAAETKILCLRALPDFVRLLALNASVFAHVWANRHGGEHVSSWRSRLKEIKRIKEKFSGVEQQPPGTGHSAAGSTATVQSGGTGTSDGAREVAQRNVRDSFGPLRRTSVANFLTNASEERGVRSPGSAGDREGARVGEGLVDNVDFTKWTG